MRKPLFLFAFANDKSESLRLQEEENIVKDIFRPLKMQDKILFESIRGATLDRIYRNFHDYHNRIAIFHYSGHSDETFLHLTDTGARSENLSKLIGMQKNLKLVFLNGCANEAQVKDLHANGVKVVIATNAKIKDEAALRFSEGFYQAFVAGNNIRDSFDVGQGYAKDKAPGTILKFRSAGFEEDVPVSDSEWVLLASEDTHLTWSIDDLQEPQKDQNVSKEVDLTPYKINFNKDLVELAFEGLSKYDVINEAFWKKYNDTPSQENFVQLKDRMLSSYPSFLNMQLSHLFPDNALKDGRLRLDELNEAYLTLMKLLSAISLADLWNSMILHNQEEGTYIINKSFKVQEAYKEIVRKFLKNSVNENANYDYGWLIGTIGRVFRDNNKTPFISEFKFIFDSFNGGEIKEVKNTELYEAYRFLDQELRTRLAGNTIVDDEVKTLCEESGKKLGILLQHCGFLCSYELVAVKQIEVIKRNRVAKAEFLHFSRRLRGLNSQVQNEESISSSGYTTNNSILISKNFSKSDEILNLSPFMIDENVYIFKEALPKIIFFKGWGENESMHFEMVENFTVELVINEKLDWGIYKSEISDIKSQMEKFIEYLS